MNTINIEINNTLKQSSNNCMKLSATDNEYSKLENSQLQIENLNYAENKMKIDEMNENINNELVKVTNNNMKD